MLGKTIRQTEAYKEYKESLGAEFINKCETLMGSAGYKDPTLLFTFVESSDLIEKSPFMYLKTNIIARALKEIKYEK